MPLPTAPPPVRRAALNLAGTVAQQITRGMVLATPGLFQSTTTLDCTLTLLPGTRPLKSHARVHFHCGTAEMIAQAVVLDGKDMKPGTTGYVQLRLAGQVLFVPGDRFMIRQFSPVVTIGGGGVLDNAPPRHRTGDTSTWTLCACWSRASRKRGLSCWPNERLRLRRPTWRLAPVGSCRKSAGGQVACRKSGWCFSGSRPPDCPASHFERLENCCWRNWRGFMSQIRFARVAQRGTRVKLGGRPRASSLTHAA